MKSRMTVVLATLICIAQAAHAQNNSDFEDTVGCAISATGCAVSTTHPGCSTGCATCSSCATSAGGIPCECVPYVRHLYPVPCLDACGTSPCANTIFGDVWCDVKSRFGNVQVGGLLKRRLGCSTSSCSAIQGLECEPEPALSLFGCTDVADDGCGCEIGDSCSEVEVACGCESPLSCLSGRRLGSLGRFGGGCGNGTCFQDLLPPSNGCRPRGLLSVIGGVLFGTDCIEYVDDSCSLSGEISCDGTWSGAACDQGGCGLGCGQTPTAKRVYSYGEGTPEQGGLRRANNVPRVQMRRVSLQERVNKPLRLNVVVGQLGASVDGSDAAREVRRVRYDTSANETSLRFRD